MALTNPARRDAHIRAIVAIALHDRVPSPKNALLDILWGGARLSVDCAILWLPSGIHVM